MRGYARSFLPPGKNAASQRHEDWPRHVYESDELVHIRDLRERTFDMSLGEHIAPLMAWLLIGGGILAAVAGTLVDKQLRSSHR